MKLWAIVLIIGLAGCASFEPLPEHCKMGSSDGFDRMVCEDIPPEGDCEKLANNMYYCKPK